MFRRLIILLPVFFPAFSSSPSLSGERPNILLIMADDVGIEGLGCYGGVSYKTPHLDRMAAAGLRFTRAYSQPLCTPTRVEIMTGQYNHRNWKYFGILDPNQKTFGHYLKDSGYTTGIFGKWQLQSYDPPDLPGASNRRGTGMHAKDAGFDRYSLFHALHTEAKGSRYTNPTMLEGTAGSEGELKTYQGQFGEDIWVDQIVDFFDATQDQPTFAYYPMALPHWPFVPTPDTPGWNPDSEQSEAPEYIVDMVQYMDKSVGSLVDKLEAKNLLDNTIVLFYSDNGTHAKVVSQMQDGRQIQGGKASTRQTGIHVPLIAYWPQKIKPGTDHDLVDASDFLPTLMDLAERSLPEESVTDGISFAHRLFNQPGPQRDSAFFWYDSRPGWDKERFRREVFALNKNFKLYRNGRLFRLTDKPLEEIEVNPLQMNTAEKRAQKELAAFIEKNLGNAQEPELVNAYGEPEFDLLYLPASKQETSEVTRRMLATGKEFSYGDPNIPQQRLWIFNPLEIAEDEKRPCVFFIHGGGWGGAPESLAAQCLYLQRRGFNAVSIHFRSPVKNLTPRDTLADARLAYRWIIDHADEHHIDTNQIFISGGSAGGHLSLASRTIDTTGNGFDQPEPAGLILFNPVIDLVDGWSNGRRKCLQAGIEPRDFSPAHHVRPGLPPMLILSGSDDSLIPPKLIHDFQKRLTAVGGKSRFIEYPEAGHGFFNYGRERNQYFQWTMWEMEKFLRQHIR
ncbi:sulfatase-like hydrolase/transferase [bacterium]|nr:sulfatase-like hydrolase/transferase [bacterium]